jgi:hypothetical protein
VPRTIRRLLLLFAIGIAACSAQLPSERPLGLGPLARRQEPPEPSGAPVTMPSGAQQMQFEADEDEGDDDSTAENATPPSPGDTPDAGVTSISDAGPAPSAVTPSSTAPTAVLDFAGDYSGKDVTTFRGGGGNERMEDPKAKLSVKKAGDALSIIVVASDTGDPICTLRATQKGDTATLPSGQECAEPQSPFLRGRLTRGQAKLQGNQLTLDMSFEVNINVGGKQITGIEYHFEGTRR